MMKYLHILIFFNLLFPTVMQAQNGNIDVFIIDSYITVDKPNKLVISFFTSDSSTSKIVLEDKYEIPVSEKLDIDHSLEYDLTGYEFDSSYASFRVLVYGKDGIETVSDKFEVIIPFKEKPIEGDAPGLFTICCMGGVIFGLPSPTYVRLNGRDYFGLAKEIPVFSFYSMGYNYPEAYISVEYEYIFNSPTKNILRTGYKQMFQPEFLEYISAGLNFSTDFKGFNGLSPELSLGLFKIQNAFTLYAKYRFNWQPSEPLRNFHEIALGLYSNFFSFNL